MKKLNNGWKKTKMNKEIKILEDLTYNSWWYQVNFYGLDKKKVRKLYQNWEDFEDRFKKETKNRENGQVSPSQENNVLQKKE
jgi:hypothetical protein